MKTNARLLIAATAAIVAIGASAGYVAAQPAPKVIKVSAKRFDYAPGRLSFKKGERVVLELTSADVVMGFNLPDFKVRADVIPGKVTRVEFVADKAGEFIFLCDVFCGSGHEEMHGTLVVRT